MARPKLYDDELLLSSIDACWNTRCHGNPRELSYKTLSAFLAESSNISIPPDTLKHNRAVHDKVSLLKAGAISQAAAACDPAADSGDVGPLLEEHRRLTEANEKLKSFISRTYVHDICLSMINEELNLQMPTIIQSNAASRSIITASEKPFSSPEIMEMAALFSLEEDNDEKNR